MLTTGGRALALCTGHACAPPRTCTGAHPFALGPLRPARRLLSHFCDSKVSGWFVAVSAGIRGKGMGSDDEDEVSEVPDGVGVHGWPDASDEGTGERRG